MVKLTNEQLKQKAIEDWHSYRKQYDLPQWFKNRHFDRSDYERFAKENGMSVSNFKKYMNYFCEYDRLMLFGR